MIHAQLYELLTYNITFDIPLYLQHLDLQKGPVLELGVGTGRTILPLLEAGFPCVGIDNNPSMISLSTNKLSAFDVSLHLADMASFSVHESFQQIQVPLRTMHLLNPKQRASTLACIEQHLLPTGHVIIHVSSWNQEAHDKIWRVHSTIPSSDGGEILIEECTYEAAHTSILHILHRIQQISTHHHVSSTHITHQQLHPIDDMMKEIRMAKLIPKIIQQDRSNTFIMATKA